MTESWTTKRTIKIDASGLIYLAKAGIQTRLRSNGQWPMGGFVCYNWGQLPVSDW